MGETVEESCCGATFAGFYISCLCHQLMADAVGAVHVPDAVLVAELIADVVMAGVVELAGGNEVVVDQDCAVRIPYLCKAHLFKFVFYKRDENIVDHDAVDIDRDDVAGFDAIGADIVCKNLFL